MLTHLKYLAVGGAMIGATVAGIWTLNALPNAALAFIAGVIAYGLGWSYYARKEGK